MCILFLTSFSFLRSFRNDYSKMPCIVVLKLPIAKIVRNLYAHAHMHLCACMCVCVCAMHAVLRWCIRCTKLPRFRSTNTMKLTVERIDIAIIAWARSACNACVGVSMRLNRSQRVFCWLEPLYQPTFVCVTTWNQKRWSLRATDKDTPITKQCVF